MSIRENFKQALNELGQPDIKPENNEHRIFNEPSQKPVSVSSNRSPDILSNSNSDNKTIITKDCIVEGSIKTSSQLEIHGVINGNINCESFVLIKGEVNGNVDAERLEISGSTINGNVISRTKATIKENTNLTGDLKAEDADIDCQIQGNIVVDSKLKVQNNAEISGDILAGSLTVVEGAVICGNVKIKKLEVRISS